MHEASMHDQNAFITLTYDNDKNPTSLVPWHLQNFFKRLRRHFANDTVRYFACGEYGAQLQRPHYHAIVFGIDFLDKVSYKQTSNGRLYTSELLDSIWGNGFTTTGDVTYQSAAYVARYVTKKITGLKAAEHYFRVDPLTGQEWELEPEFSRVSKGRNSNGLGADWFRLYKTDVTQGDALVVNGAHVKVPRYYDKLRERQGDDMEPIKKARIARAREYESENTPDRLRVREVCFKRRIDLLQRKLEDET